MNNQQLMEALSKYPPDASIIVGGIAYDDESGYIEMEIEEIEYDKAQNEITLKTY